VYLVQRNADLTTGLYCDTVLTTTDQRVIIQRVCVL